MLSVGVRATWATSPKQEKRRDGQNKNTVVTLRTLRRLYALLLGGFLCLLLAAPSKASPLTPDQIAVQIQPLHPKTLVLVFDVTASTRTGGVFQQERAASATLIRDGCMPGDRLVLLSFGTGYKTVFDKALTSDADKDALIDMLPPSVEPGQGTNIRWPHHVALDIIAHDLPRPGVVILLTDSFNDRPVLSDPNYPKYLAYYTLKSLTVYPNTGENSAYEHRLAALKTSGKLHQFGVGVGIAPSGRPIERLPVGPGQGDTDTDSGPQAPTVLTPIGQETPRRSYIVPISAGIIALLLIPLIFLLLGRPTPVRLQLGDKGTPRDYHLKPGAKIGLGGSLTSAAPGDDVFPLAGFSAPPAFIEGVRGGALVAPAPNMPLGATVFHNGIRLEQPAPLRIGDEIRLVLPATEVAPAREHRVRFADPKGSLV